MSRYALIMAGGQGTRLWPMSRRATPKQLLPFAHGGTSLFRTTLDRLERIFDPQNVYVIAGEDQLPPMREALGDVPEGNFIGEPSVRDTANAIGLGCAILAPKDPDGTVGVFTADHIIEPIDTFQHAVLAALNAVETHPDYLGTLGIKPRSAHPGLGYIHRGRPLGKTDVPTFEVKGFKEKPDQTTAEQYLASGEYYWNSGMFVWKLATIMAELRKHLPHNALLLEELASLFGKPDWPRRSRQVYDQLEKISIDFAVMEKAEKVLTVELDCHWADVGTWGELQNVTGLDESGNAVLADRLLAFDSKDNVVVSSQGDHLIATIGIKDLIVVHTPDATLICTKDQAQRIKELVSQLKIDFGEAYL